MNLREAAQQALEAYDAHEPLAVVMEALRTALAEPEQRKPLTDEEIELLAAKHAPPIDPDFGDDDWIDFARAIERAHGIGGEA